MINIKKVIAYIVILGLAVLYTLFLEAPGGSYLIIALVSAALISLAICVYTKHKLTARIDVGGDILSRGDNAPVTLILEKSGIFPSAFITAELFASYHFTTSSQTSLHTAVFGSGTVRFSAEYRAEFFGKGRIGISTITVTDYLGLCSFRVNISHAVSVIKICPDIPEVSSRDGLARSLTDAAAFDESEETTQSLYAVNGTPGYEHRKYEPGDSLKLINWKISAKRGEFYVRRLEGASGAEQTFILDKAGSKNPDALEARHEEQLTVEAMLGLMMQFAKTELPSKLMIRISDEWQTIPCTTPSDVSDIRYMLTDLEFSENEVGRLPSLPEGHCILFTPRCDALTASFVSGYENRCAAAPSCAVPAENIWLITRDADDIRFVR